MASVEMPVAVEPKDASWRWVPHAFFGANVIYIRIFYEQMGTSIAPHTMGLLATALLLAWMSEWERHTLWVHVYGCLLAQMACDSVPILLPQGFVLYAAIPLLLLGVGEVIVVATMATPVYRDYAARVPHHTWRSEHGALPSRTVRFVYGLYNEKEIRRWYALLFEVYMTLCSLALALRGSFLRAPCIASAYVVVVGLVFLAAEDLRETRLADDVRLPLPSAAVKAVYALYAPARFVHPLLWLAAATLVIGGSPKHADINHSVATLICVVAAVAAILHRDIDACPV